MMNRILLFTAALLTTNFAISQNVGVDVAAPEQKLDVAGGLKIGNTGNGVAGSLRWNGSTFEFHDGIQWTTLSADTDDQFIDVATLVGTNLQLSLDGDGVATQVIDLSSLIGTDDQQITGFSINNTTKIITLTLESGGTQTIDLTTVLAAAGTDDQQLTLTGNILAIEAGNTVDLNAVDNQQLSLSGNTLSLQDGGSVDLEAVDNQGLDILSLSGTTLEVSLDNNATTTTLDLDPLRRQLIDGAANANNTWIRVAADAGTNNDLIRMTTAGTERLRVDNVGNVGIGTNAEVIGARLQVQVDDAAGQSYPLIIRNEGAVNTGGTGVGIGFNTHGASSAPKMALYAERTSDFTQGKMHFLLSDVVDNSEPNLTSHSRMTIQSDGNVGIANTSPAQELDVTGTVRVSTLAGGGVVISNGSGDLSTATDLTGTGLGDNLGDHTATTNLNMANREVDNVTFTDYTPGNGNGIRFWSSNAYAIAMGNAAEYQYGPVTDYSIKNHMSNDVGRGWTWGVDGLTPVAAINKDGFMQIAKTLTVSGDNTTGGGINISDAGGIYDRNDAYGTLAFSSGVDMEDTQDGTDHLSFTFDDSYPEIAGYRNNSPTLVEFKTGMYNNGGTFYSQNQMFARAGIANDAGTLTLNDNVLVTSLVGGGVVRADAAGNLSVSPNLIGTGLGDNLGNHTATTTLNMNNSAITNASLVSTTSADSYDKLRVYSSSSYTIGMKSAQTYGGLNDWAMTFTMNTDSDRGWLFRDVSDAASDGAMSLTTTGLMTVKESVRAPIFYDVQNTAYYADPASTSVFNSHRVNILYDNNSTTYFWDGNAATSMRTFGNIQIGYGSTSDDDYLYFDQNAEYLRWDESPGEFDLSDDLNMQDFDLWDVNRLTVNTIYSVDDYPGDPTGDYTVHILDRVRIDLPSGQDFYVSNDDGRTTLRTQSWNHGQVGRLQNYWYSTWKRIDYRLTEAGFSDARLKKNIRDLDQASSLDKILSLNGKMFDLADNHPFMQGVELKTNMDFAASTNVMGFLAQEIQQVLPEMVIEDEESGYLMLVDTEQLFPVIIEAMKEQQKQIEELKTLVNSLLKSKN